MLREDGHFLRRALDFEEKARRGHGKSRLRKKEGRLA